MPFEFFPNTNFHDLNLDYILEKAQKIDDNLRDSQASANAAKASEDAAAASETAAQLSEEAAAASEAAAKDYADHIADPVSGLVTDWLEDNITQETGYVLDTSLTSAAAAAPAKTVGDRVLLNYGTITAAQYPSATNFPDRSIVFVPSTEQIADLPTVSGNFAGTVITLKAGTTLGMQIAICNGGVYSSTFGKLFWRTIVGDTYYDWQSTVSDKTFSSHLNTVSAFDIGKYALLGNVAMVTNADRLSTVTGGTMSVGDFPINRIVVVGASIADIVDYPCDNLSDPATSKAQGVYITTGMNGNTGAGSGQLFIGSYTAFRWRISSGWLPWKIVKPDPQEYHVGPTRTYTSLTALCMDLASNTQNKVIYLDPGVYDIYQEYRDAGIPTPPDDVTSSDYLTRCVFLPRNTRLVGVGNVTLRFMPDAADITTGEANTWSPLNIKYACEVENVTIECLNGRYCIHDDSHNASSDQGVDHIYRNVTAIYHDSSKGFLNTTGFGFSAKNNYLFDRCTFIYDGSGHTAFYAHGSSSAAVDSPNVTFDHCLMKTTGGKALRLQNLGTYQLETRVNVNSSVLQGSVSFENYTDNAKQGFKLRLLNSGSPSIVYNSHVLDNPYPPEVYNAT